MSSPSEKKILTAFICGCLCNCKCELVTIFKSLSKKYKTTIEREERARAVLYSFY